MNDQPGRAGALGRLFAGVPGVVWELPGRPADGMPASFVSSFTRTLLGYEPEQWLGTAGFWLSVVHPEDRERALSEADAIFDHGGSGVIQCRWLANDGRVLWIVTFANALDEDDARRFRAFSFDITPYRRAVQRLATQNAITTVLAESADIEAAAKPLLRAVGESLDWEVGGFWLVDQHAGVLRCVDTWSLPRFERGGFIREMRETAFSSGQGLPGRVWSLRKPAWIPDVTRDDNFARAKLAVEDRLHAGFAFPIVLGGDVLGVAEFFSHRILEPDRELLQMTAGIGAQIGQFVERRRAEKSLRDSERTLRQVLDSALDAVIGIDADGMIQAWNQQAATTFGWTAEAAIGRRLSELIIPERFRDAHEHGLTEARRTGEGRVIGRRIEIEAIDKDGNEFPVELAITSTRAGAAYTFNAFARDISARRHRDQMKDDFLAFASHELRSPLTTVSGLAKWLEKQTLVAEPLTEDARGAIETLSAESERLVQMVELFLDLTRIDSDRLVMEMDTVDLPELLMEEAALVSARHPHVDVQVVLGEPELMISSDAIRLRQVLVNLLDNAAKYAGAAPHVTVTLERQPVSAVISVADDGPGLNDEDLPRIFDRFYRSPGHAQKGLGIGLFVSKEIVEKLGGSIVACRSATGGAEFRVTLPLTG